jgi:hypothetical protein
LNATDYLRDVVRERHHPSILSWYLADDTASYVQGDTLKALHDAIHSIDKAHLTSQADAVGTTSPSRYYDFVHSTDIFMPEVYPLRVGVAPKQAIPQVIADMKAIQQDLADNGNPVKSIWPIIQYFDGWGGWDTMPTFQELRCMSYLSIIHGGNGITWYTYGGFDKNHGVTSTPETWKNICIVATELNKLQDVFLTEGSGQPVAVTVTDGPQKDAKDYDSINVLYKRLGDKQFLICANSADADVSAKFNAKGASSCQVWFENRTLPMDGDGTFADVFKPFDVHVYELK